MTKEIFCTIGPASNHPRILTRLAALGVSLFRINLSHTRLADVARTIDHLREHADVPICLDTEGAQIRTGDLVDGAVEVRENDQLCVARTLVPGDVRLINFYPLHIVEALKVGDFISIDFNAVLAQVVRLDADGAQLRILNGGRIGRNKAVTVERPIEMAPLTDKDIAALAIGRDKGIRHVALSFANSGADVDVIRSHVSPETAVISKIECRNGVRHLREISQRSDSILIDRGDLSREYPVERIPALQKRIVSIAKAEGCNVYVATNLLESMVTEPVPTRAEVNDVYNTLLDGADGLVLAAETAIGTHPVACANMVVRLIKAFEANTFNDEEAGFQVDSTSLLVPPHGGILVHRMVESREPVKLEPHPVSLTVPETILIDCEQIATGVYSPVDGFMDRETLDSVLKVHRLPSNDIWTMPLLLQVRRDDVARVVVGEQVALKSMTGTTHAVIDVSEIWTSDPALYARSWFGTENPKHPGVARLLRGGDSFVAGKVTLVERIASAHRHFELTPIQTRFVFTRKGWTRVVGFHTRNVVHRVHEFIQLDALERTNADGLYISPVTGPRKTGDFLSDPILRAYQMMLDFRLYPAGKVLLGSFASYPRYAGPREAVFTAFCRKNMGCSHFIVGRDHTGVGNFYESDANRKLFDALGDIGIEPIFYDAIGFDPKTESYTNLEGRPDVHHISGTEAREALLQGKALPNWYMRDIIQDYLRGELRAGRRIFSP